MIIVREEMWDSDFVGRDACWWMWMIMVVEEMWDNVNVVKEAVQLVKKCYICGVMNTSLGQKKQPDERHQMKGMAEVEAHCDEEIGRGWKCRCWLLIKVSIYTGYYVDVSVRDAYQWRRHCKRRGRDVV